MTLAPERPGNQSDPREDVVERAPRDDEDRHADGLQRSHGTLGVPLRSREDEVRGEGDHTLGARVQPPHAGKGTRGFGIIRVVGDADQTVAGSDREDDLSEIGRERYHPPWKVL